MVNIKEKIKKNLQDNLDEKTIKKLLRIMGTWPVLSLYGIMFSSISDKYLNILSIKSLKKAYSGNFNIAYGSLFLPYELFHSLGLAPFLPEVMAGFTAGMGISTKTLKEASSKWYSQDLCTFHRSASGAVDMSLFPKPDFILCSNLACDAAQKSFFIYAKKFGIPDNYYLIDVPYQADNASLSYLASQIEYIFKDISMKKGIKPDIDKLKKTIILSNEFRSWALKIDDIRKKLTNYPPDFNGLNFILPFFSFNGSKEGILLYKKMHKELKDYLEKKRKKNIKKILWLHLKPYYRNEIFDILAQYNCRVVCEEINYVYWDEMDPEKPFESIAKKMLSNYLNGSCLNRVRVIEKMIEEYEIDGVILFAHWGCRQSNGSIRIIKDAVRKHNIPILALDGDCVDIKNSAIGQIKTRVEGFAEIVSGS